MADDNLRPIVIKRIKKVAGGHHGGAWKIAYADFVTAMMAFFLLMWLLGSTSKGDLKGIAEYFSTPLKVAMAGGAGSGATNSILDSGGGKDLTAKAGQVKKGSEPPGPKKSVDAKAAQAALEKIEVMKLKGLKARLEAAIDASPSLKQFKNQLLIDITTEGLRIQIVDDQNRPMFAIAKADLQSYTREILHEIGIVLNEMPNKISLSGHTDATPYSTGNKGYSNWELSSDRANASRRELILGGIADDKIVRVVGLASSVLIDRENPTNPINRRISIIVMNRQAEDAAKHDGGTIKVGNDTDVAEVLKSGSSRPTATTSVPAAPVATIPSRPSATTPVPAAPVATIPSGPTTSAPAVIVPKPAAAAR